ncbi:GNAT family N-acetyltransferase [Rudaeicoccus suwonensis]|uniref:N-acetyltransferase domain-containing protein n=1 Tax=Rudaeicoccus suwonensis TaxID=657409 RepID=A0A561E943_9MICO|nr:GNAT family N-acetyltransferase [Rudaeicoccus suwonensis]TWE12121.1 hypothetical protein BKA23_0917 [Rudaeicoccus suwonensis]
MPVSDAALRTRLLDSSTWDDFAALVEANNGVWGGCWCLGRHVGQWGDHPTPERNRLAKQDLVSRGGVHQVLVYDGDVCVGWCQFGTPAEILTKNPAAYQRELRELPDWRIGCIFTGSKHRGHGVARAAVAGALREIAAAGGGLVEAYPEQQDGRPPQRGAYFHTGPESLFAGFGFTRDRKIAKWRWVMRLEVKAAAEGHA